MPALNLPVIRPLRPAWNKGRIVGQKRPLLPKQLASEDVVEIHRTIAV